MVRIIILLIQLLIFFGNIYAQNIWQRQQTPTNMWLNKCSFPDSLNGWAAGEEGVIIRTSNGGTNWLLANSPVDFFIYDIYFLNTRLGWGLANDNFANGTAVLSTTNGGNNWSFYRFPDSTILLYSVHFKDSLNGLMAGYGGKIFRTTNGGLNWLQAQVDSSFSSYFPVNKVSMENNLGIAAGGAFDIIGVMWTSTNGGLNWKSSGITGEPLFCYDILSPTKVIALGGDYEFGAIQARTYNAGTNWSVDYLNTYGIARGLSFRTMSEGWAVLSISARFLYTLDTGNTWNTMNVPDTIPLYDIIFTDPYHGYAVGLEGAVFRYNSSAIGINNNQNRVPAENKLLQNYPNPFNPITTIEYFLIKPSVVKVTIYDVTGRLVKQLYEGLKIQGMHKIKFDASDLSSGMYLYKLEAGLYSEAKKLVILK